LFDSCQLQKITGLLHTVLSPVENKKLKGIRLTVYKLCKGCGACSFKQLRKYLTLGIARNVSKVHTVSRKLAKKVTYMGFTKVYANLPLYLEQGRK
jgi:Fe2+ or Zn2+ uptake regulation protein